MMGSPFYSSLLGLLTVLLLSSTLAEPSPTFLDTIKAQRLLKSYDISHDHDLKSMQDGYSKLRYTREADPELDIRDNCSDIHNPPPQYNGSICELVLEECDDKYELFNYLELVICRLGESLEALGFILLGLWLVYLLLLLSSTVDTFFVPVLHMLSNKLRLPPSIAGMTLLALGNGSPDIFVAFSALIKDDDLALMLGALLGAGLFITSVVLGTVLMVARSRNYNIDMIDFMRDIIAYAIVLAVIIAVSFDGKVYLVEAAVFPVTYIGYVAVVIGITFFRKWLWNRKHRREIPPEEIAFNKEQSQILIKESPPKHPGDDGPTLRDEIERSIKEAAESLKAESTDSMDSDSGEIKKIKEEETIMSDNEDAPKSDIEASTNLDIEESTKSEIEESTKSEVEESLKEENAVSKKSEGEKSEVKAKKRKIELPGLTMPKGAFKKIHCVLLWPFSFLRWLTIPPCCHDGNWSVFHYGFAVFSPVPMSLLLMIVASEHWSVYEMTVGDSSFPVPVLVVLCVSPLCIPLLFLLSWKKPPNKVMQIVLLIFAFVMSICWLYLIADEVVAVLQAIGLLASISTAVLGLTVLAIGNSVADWVADTVVSYSGKPEMALASCFGAPLITHVMGLSFAFLARMIADGGHVYTFDILSEEFVHVKMVWIFLAFTLFGSAIIFPLFKFSPPKEYGIILMYVYCVFMVFSVLIELDIMRVFV